jgi:L-asparaginase
VAKVVCFTTGGTIASAFDPRAGGLRVSLGGDRLIRSVPGVEAIADIEVVELANTSSTFHRPEQVFAWTRRVRERLAEPDVIGVVLTHGTDTLEESAYLFDLALSESKPVVFTGAMRPPEELAHDGPRNLLCAVRVAAHSVAGDLGVLVVMNEEIHAARDVTKTHADALHAFASPNLGPLGVMVRRRGCDEVAIRRRPIRREHISTESIESHVAYVKAVMGSDSDLIDAARLGGARGIVLEAFGGGEISPYMADGVDRARAEGIELVVATRAQGGRPLDLYGDVGEGTWLRDRGVRFAGDITGPKARIKLMLALAYDNGRNVAQFFE